MKHISEIMPGALAHLKPAREIPALFSAPMVRANLAGTKTQTRRPLYVLRKAVGAAVSVDQRYPPPLISVNEGLGAHYTLSGWAKAKPGERIWQRETWARGCGHSDDDTVCIAYAASQDGPNVGPAFPTMVVNNIPRPAAVDLATWQEDEKWTPSIHMPRWACRFYALITEVRIQRLQDISEADAIAEGCDPFPAIIGNDDIMIGRVLHEAPWKHRAPGSFLGMPAPVARYVMLWDKINGDTYPWNSNPWVVAVTYAEIKS